MGSCCSRSKNVDSDNEDSVSEDKNTFNEVEQRKSSDGGIGNSGDKVRNRRRSSGLSRFSTKDLHVVEKPFKIAAFNVQRFGAAKMKNATVVEILVKIIQQFDIVLIQEIVDTSGHAVNDLLDSVNKNSDVKYELVISPRLGRTKQKEQYAFLFKSNRVQVKETHTYPDPKDVFIREPFIVQFTSSAVHQSLNNFTIMAIHTQPSQAPVEIDALMDVHNWILTKINTCGTLIMGDLNAGGVFVRPQDWEKNRLRQDKNFSWLIPDHYDTTATNTLAAYDRIVAHGNELLDCIIPNSAKVYRYDEDMGLDETTLLQVSDHFPVSVDLKPAIHPTLEKNIIPKLGIIVYDKRFPNVDFNKLSLQPKMGKFSIFSYYDNSQQVSRVEIRSQKISKIDEVLKSLEKLRNLTEGLLSYSLLSTLKYKLTNGNVTDNSLDHRMNERSFWVSIVADIQRKSFFCSIEMSTFIA